jgi:hypothetical protein
VLDKLQITRNWLPRYTGMPLEKFGKYILLTNFSNYVSRFAEQFNCRVYGEDRTMQASTNDDGLTIINFGMGSSNAATIMDLLGSVSPKGVLFLGKCGGLKESSEIGHFILPIGAIRGEGTSDDYFPPEVPALPSFKLHKFVSEELRKHDLEYRTGVIYTGTRPGISPQAVRHDLYRHRHGNRHPVHRWSRQRDRPWGIVAGFRCAGHTRRRQDRRLRPKGHRQLGKPASADRDRGNDPPRSEG